MKQDVILSLYDESGNWPLPYKEAGYKIIQVDLNLGIDILKWDYKNEIQPERIRGVLNATPCTAYALSGARWWPQKDADGTTDYFNPLTRKGIEIIKWVKQYSDIFWALENPIGRIDICVPELKPFRRLEFNPCDFGDPYTKKTRLWGEFNPWLIKSPVPATEGSKIHLKYGGKSARTKKMRSITPMGFAYAFYQANP